jgi:hypothetical protein
MREVRDLLNENRINMALSTLDNFLHEGPPA